jgi:hypothetical protein
MSALGQKQTWRIQTAMSALPPIADIAGSQFDVRFVPKAYIGLAAADVCFTPESGRLHRSFVTLAFPQRSAL